MSHRVKAGAAMSGSKGRLGIEKLKQLLSVSVLTITVVGCGSPAGRDVLTYDACVTRHPQEVALCEGPRQAYELNPTAIQTRAASVSSLADSSYQEHSVATQPAFPPTPPRPSLIAAGRNE